MSGVYFLLLYFQLRNPSSDNCLDTLGNREGKTVGVYRCHGQGNHQVSVSGTQKQYTLQQFTTLNALSVQSNYM